MLRMAGGKTHGSLRISLRCVLPKLGATDFMLQEIINVLIVKPFSDGYSFSPAAERGLTALVRIS